MKRRKIPVLVLALVEGAVAFFSVYAAACLRYQTPISHLSQLEAEFGPLWPRAAIFAVFVVLSLWAFGHYGGRQRAQPLQLLPKENAVIAALKSIERGVLVRAWAAVAIAACGLAAVFYFWPSMKLWRGVEVLAVLITGLGIMISRLVNSARS